MADNLKYKIWAYVPHENSMHELSRRTFDSYQAATSALETHTLAELLASNDLALEGKNRPVTRFVIREITEDMQLFIIILMTKDGRKAKYRMHNQIDFVKKLRYLQANNKWGWTFRVHIKSLLGSDDSDSSDDTCNEDTRGIDPCRLQ